MPYHVVKKGDKFVVEKQDGSKAFGSHATKAEADKQMAALYANEPKARGLHLRGALGAVRTELWEGREHLVVPMVALMEGVIHAVNAPSAEFVPGAVIEQSVGKWAGHPIVVGHPVRDGKQISAHDPTVLAKHGVGFIRSSAMNGSRLVHETLIDPARLVALKQDALLADLRAGKGCEVSVGAFVTTNDTRSTYGGKQYDGEWTDIGPDHTALLPGGRGACSMEMGCGAHRAAERYLVTAEGFSIVEETIIDPETLRCLRDVPQSVRDEMKASDFAGPNETYPIKTQADVDAAKRLIGKAADQEAVKKRIIAIAKRKGLTIPDAWQVKAAAALPDKSQVDCATCAGTGKIRGGNVTCPDCKGKGVMKGASMNLKNLKARILALFDTPEQAASEEAAELVAYNAMRAQMDAAGDAWDAASALVDDLIADETENPTETPEQEDAEEEVETARLDAVRMHCYTAIAALQSVCNACSDQQMPEPMPTSDPRYMAAFRAAIGKEISAKNMKVIQAAHDSSHDVHSQTVALGAQCNGMKLMAAKMMDCPTCDGSGQVKVDGKQGDCPTCGGEGEIRAAESDGGSAVEEDQMKKADAIKALTACPCSGFTEADAKQLEAFSEERLTALAEAATARKKVDDDLKAAQDKAAKAEADLKAAQAAQIPAEELTSLRALAEERKQRETAEKAALVTRLATASKALAKEQLEAKPLDELRTLAAFAKVEAPVVDYSVKGIPVPRNAADGESYAAPNAYEPGLKALRAAESKAVN